jgi:hypothetical protein
LFTRDRLEVLENTRVSLVFLPSSIPVKVSRIFMAYGSGAKIDLRAGDVEGFQSPALSGADNEE